MLATLDQPSIPLLDVPADALDKLRRAPRVLLFGHSHNYHKVAFVTASYEIFPVLLKEEPLQRTTFLPSDFSHVMRSAESHTCSVVTRREARSLLRACSYYRTTSPNPLVFQKVLEWLS
jgi:hypothetical protein